jgi:hypothetical protein
MKNQTTETSAVETKNTNPPHLYVPRLSDNAFYLIALAVLLRKSVQPAKLKEYLVPQKFTGFRSEGTD